MLLTCDKPYVGRVSPASRYSRPLFSTRCSGFRPKSDAFATTCAAEFDRKLTVSFRIAANKAGIGAGSRGRLLSDLIGCRKYLPASGGIGRPDGGCPGHGLWCRRSNRMAGFSGHGEDGIHDLVGGDVMDHVPGTRDDLQAAAGN